MTSNSTPNKKIRIAIPIVLLLVASVVLFRIFVSGVSKESEPSNAALPQASTNKTLRIGVLLPLSGADADVGASSLAGLRVAESEIREQGGILGRDLKLHILDTRSDYDLSIEMALELMNRAKVSLVIGVLSEEATLAVAQLARDKKTPFIYYSDGPPKTCLENDQLKPSPYVWGFGSTQQMRVEPFLIQLAEMFREPEAQFTFYYLSSDKPVEDRLSRLVVGTAESLGFTTVGDVTVDARVRDHFQGIRTIFSHSPDVLFLTFSREGLSSFIPQAKKLGVKGEMKVAAIGSFNEEMLVSLGDTADGIHSTTHYLSEIDSPQNKNFLKLWEKVNSKGPSSPSAAAVYGGYSPLKIAAKAYAKAESIKADKFSKAMDHIELDGPQGRIVVSASNHLLVQPLYSVTAENGHFKLNEFLGDVSHPALESCAVVERVDEDEAATQRNYQRDRDGR